MSKHVVSVFMMVFIPFLCYPQEVEDLTILPGFKIEKVLNLNRATDCQGIAFDEGGNLIVASMLWKLHKITPTGEVTTLAQFSPNRGPNPFDIEITPQGDIYFTHSNARTDPGLFRLEYGEPVRVTPEGWRLSRLEQDGLGNFYASGGQIGEPYGLLKLSDDDSDGFFDVELLRESISISGLEIWGNFIYTILSGGDDDEGRIRKHDMDGNFVDFVADTLNYPRELEIDSLGNMYTTVFVETRTEGLGNYSYRDVLRIEPDGNRVIVAEDIVSGVYLSMSPDDVLYISEFSKGLVARLEEGGTKTYVNNDYGLSSPSGLGFDIVGNPYLSSFRLSRLYRIDPDEKSLIPITEPLGWNNQTIAVDDQGMFYVSNYDPRAMYKIDPKTGDVEFLSDVWTRTLQFDSYGRLVITSHVEPAPLLDDYICTVGIVDLDPFQITHYITGIKNLERGFLFDEDQNFYVKRGRSEGIIKVNVPMNPQGGPVDISEEPLFVDLQSKDSEIRFFDRTVDGRLLIPLNERGELVLAEPGGSWSDFASGFSWPGHVDFDPNGIAYVVDGDNGIFRIIGEEFVVPAVVKRNRDLCDEIYERVSNQGIKNSLCQKLSNASSDLEKGNIKAAINVMKAFVNEVNAKTGKKISFEDAELLVTIAESIIAGLELL